MIYPRIMKSLIEKALKYFPVVLLTGARQVGKSTLALDIFESYMTFDDITVYSSARSDPKTFINSLKKPVVIDEVQKMPEILDTIKMDVDRKRTNGSYLLTGSSNIMAYKNIADTLAGRIAVLELMPLSCREMASRNDNVLDALFSQKISGVRLPDIKHGNIIMHVINGGYPEILKIDDPKGRYLWFGSYISTYIERDIRAIGDLRHMDKFLRMFNMLASRSSQVLIKSDIARDAGIDSKTLDNYLKLLELTYQICLLKPYSRNINKRFVKSNKIFFTDSGIASYLLGISSSQQLMSSPYKGAVLETFVFAELLKAVKYAEQPAELFFYRTSDRKEIDFIIERGDSIAAVEVKFSQTVTKSDFRHIIDLQKSAGKLAAGYVFYMGEHILPFGENLYALPVRILF
ncbi:MAG: ATP-binding protein [Nitrospiraceae bacterium]|nr:MAG: ATP-binding protein [Nitrospiraceae bacterium]